MIVAVAPEPCGWLATIAPRPDLVIAPWALGPLARRIRVPQVQRRILDGAQRWPGWILVEGVVSAWAGADVGRRLASRFALRRAVDALAAARLPADARVVIAPTGAAERLFARAASQGAERVLVMDGPALRRLHDDLDAAALRHPDARFLRRFRAPAREIARQETEWAMATRVVVRSAYARDAVRGVPVGLASAAAAATVARPTRTLLLAGGGAARGGSYEALSAIDRVPDATLLVTPGEGLEPAALRAHPRVRVTREGDWEHIAAVLAPSWCEAHPPELTRARALGIPRIATAQSAGAGDLVVARGDVDGLTAAIINSVLQNGNLAP